VSLPLRNNSERILTTGFAERSQIARHRGVDPGLDLRGHEIRAVVEALRPCFGLRRAIVTKRHRSEVTLSEWKPDRFDLVDHQLHWRYAFVWLRQSDTRTETRRGERIYHLPGSLDYAKIKMAAPGKRWFCTEEEAEAAGWRPAKR
jgi:hypothetical protein